MTTPTLEELGLSGPSAVLQRAEAELTLGRRLRAWGSVHRQSLLCMAAVLALIGLVHGWGVARAPGLSDDEGTYMSQAWAVQHAHGLAPYTYWYDHPPLGWIQIAAYSFLVGLVWPVAHAVVVGRSLMVVLSVVSAGLLYVLGRRVGMSRPIATVAVVLFAFSPLSLDFQRMVYLDNIAVPWLLAALVLAASPRRSLWAACGAGGCFAASVLSKETFLLFAPALLVLFWTRWDRKTRAFCLTGLLSTFVLLAAAYPLYAVLKGELVPGAGHVSLWQGVQFQLSGRQGSGTIFAAGSNLRRTVDGWLRLDSWLLGLGLLSVPLCYTVRRYIPLALGLTVPVLVAMRGGYLPDPFLIGLLPFAALCIGGAADVIQHWVSAAGLRAELRGRQIGATVLSAVAAGAGAFWLASLWYPGDRSLTHSDSITPVFQAEAWIESHVPANRRLIVDNTLWTDLVEHGFNRPLGVVWFQKLDFTENLDPSVARALPGGWHDFAYVVSTPTMRDSLYLAPSGFGPVRQALAHSLVARQFGEGDDAVEIRVIQGSGPLATVK